MAEALSALFEHGLLGALLTITIGAVIFLWKENKAAVAIALAFTEKVTAALNNSTSVLSGHETSLNSRAAAIDAQTNALVALQKEMQEIRKDIGRIEDGIETLTRGGAR